MNRVIVENIDDLNSSDTVTVSNQITDYATEFTTNSNLDIMNNFFPHQTFVVCSAGLTSGRSSWLLSLK